MYYRRAIRALCKYLIAFGIQAFGVAKTPRFGV